MAAVTPGWANELSAGAPPELVAAAVRVAASTWLRPDRLRTVVAAQLERDRTDAAAVLDAVTAQATAAGAAATDAQADVAAQALLAAGATVAVVGQPGYPDRLADAWPELGAPLWLFVRSREGGLPDGPAVAVVGTRQPTLDGVRTARELAGLLGRNGVTVVSGMARGIDQAAHAGALHAGGATVAVLGTGFGVDYPTRDGAVRDAVASSGGLATELLPGVPPAPRNFLWRNRIVSGLADVTVVVEGRARSGALHTARLAAAQGREVMAVPGSLSAATSRAPLDLIRDGATPVTRLSDVVEAAGVTAAPDGAGALAAAVGRPTSALGGATVGDAISAGAAALSPVAADVLGLLGAQPASPGSLAQGAGRPVAAVLAAVAELSAAGLAATTPRGVVAKESGAVSR